MLKMKGLHAREEAQKGHFVSFWPYDYVFASKVVNYYTHKQKHVS